MCWSGEASAGLALMGFVTTAYSVVKKDSPQLWVCLFFFSLMELLQAFTYTVIDLCDSPLNQLLTLLGGVHIALQPFFINLISLYFIPKEISNKICHFVYGLCIICPIAFVIHIYPFSWAGTCQIGRLLCGDMLCSVSGNWHISWLLPLNGIGNGLFILDNISNYSNLNISSFIKDATFPYLLCVFILPILYGSWKITFFHIILGPVLASLTTNNINEWPAVWCLLSIGIILVIIKTPFRRILHVKYWFWWNLIQKN